MKHNFFLVLSFMLISPCLSFSKEAHTAKIIGSVDSALADGSACLFNEKGNPNKMVWIRTYNDEENGPWISIKGKTQRFEEIEKIIWPVEKGQKFRLTFRAGETIVYLDLQRTGEVCEDRIDRKECEGAQYGGKMTAIADGVRQVIAVDGGCGS